MKATFQGKVAAITGAGSGIGRALALGLADRGARLALSDVNDTTLAETADMVRAKGAEVDTKHLDVGDLEAWRAYAAHVKDHFGIVHQIYNNAGIARGGGVLLDLEDGQMEDVFRINLWGVIHGTRVFLPHLIESGDGQVVNISSLNGLMAQGGMTAYCTSKFAVRGFTETVRIEMLLGELPVKVCVVHPGGIKTNIATAAMDDNKSMTPEERAQAEARMKVYNEKLFKTTADEAAAVILNGVARGKSRIVITGQAKFLDRLIRLMPERYPLKVAKWQKQIFGD
ncbi:SDR family NAD(P)-dependent oxidoreductase [Kordiimonas marina]|uniref:SDR family NAD(P)-dependent oxidoreductase n=1 Tax=Kordiimonas marina TaxID=2872312 RepID=UPI001FF4FCCF|nr:SDR family NAD(P)-dependent oxidoreductase [Kordiimonas marina]MCJ9430525.1 SDR family NAD(P)-dependent oxidoreductase [Kordiimonas marina]